MSGFLDKVKQLQWDDHRYYHQCRINQTLHLVSAISFLVAYLMLFIDPAVSGLIGWLVGMVTRQSGHIFFEPRGFDPVHGVSDAYKESIKVGFNMHRKGILIGVWLSLPLLLLASPSLFGMIEASHDRVEFIRDVGLLWLALGGRRSAVSYRAPVLPAQPGLGSGMGRQDRARSVPQRRAVLGLSTGAAAWPALRPHRGLGGTAGRRLTPAWPL